MIPRLPALPGLGGIRRRFTQGVLVMLAAAYIGGGLGTGAFGLAVAARASAAGGASHSAGRFTWTVLLDDVYQLRQRVSDLRGVLPNPLPDWEGAERFNVLLLGLDERLDEQQAGVPGRTDVMLLLSVAPAEHSVGLISLPRDLAIVLPGVGETKLNTAYTYGELRQRGGGPALAKQAVAELIGQPVEYYAVVDFTGFVRLVDLVGGIVIDVPRPLKDDEYPTDDYGIQRLYLPAGLQWMDGATALRYVRSRHSDSDFGRMRRQQQVLLALRERVLRWPVLLRAPQLVEQARSVVRTDLSPRQLLALVKLGQQVGPNGLRTLVLVPPLLQEAQGRDGEYLLRVDRARLRQALATVLAPEAATPPRPIVVEAASGQLAQAQALVQYLNGLGYATAGPRVVAPPARSLIRASSVARAEAEVLARVLGLPPEAVQEEAALPPDSALEVVVGADFHPEGN